RMRALTGKFIGSRTAMSDCNEFTLASLDGNLSKISIGIAVLTNKKSANSKQVQSATTGKPLNRPALQNVAVEGFDGKQVVRASAGTGGATAAGLPVSDVRGETTAVDAAGNVVEVDPGMGEGVAFATPVDNNARRASEWAFDDSTGVVSFTRRN